MTRPPQVFFRIATHRFRNAIVTESPRYIDVSERNFRFATTTDGEDDDENENDRSNATRESMVYR